MSVEAFAALDIEAEDWTKVRTVCTLTANGEVEHFPDVIRAAEWIKKARRPVFAHHGGGYDFPLLMPGALRVGAPLQSMSLVDGKIGSAMLGGVWLHDSKRLLPGGIASLGKWAGIEKFEGRSDRIGELTQKEIEEHAERDCAILVEVLNRHRAWVRTIPEPTDGLGLGWPKTGGANASYLFRALEPAAVRHLSAHPIDPDTWAEHYDCHQSARTEAFFIGRAPRVWVYDVRSSYARSFTEAPLPVGPWEEVIGERPGQGVWYCPEVRQGRGLPVTLLSSGPRRAGKGWLTSEEIRAIREAGGDATVERGWLSREEMPLGGKVVDLVYPLKSSGYPWGKSILTAMAGKLIQELIRDTYFHTPAGYVRDRDLQLPTWSHRPLIGCFVYARARLRLWKAMQEVLARGFRVYYCDTDSIHTDCPPAHFPGVVGNACGDWQIEVERAQAIYLGPKFYGLKRQLRPGEAPGRDWRAANGGLVFKVVCTGFNPRAIGWRHLEMVLKGEVPTLTDEGGITGALAAMAGRPAEVRRQTRSLRALSGGKKRGADGWLNYPED